MGLGAWWWQRLTAVYLALFLVLALGWLVGNPPLDYAQWREWLGLYPVRVALALFVLAVGVHGYIGMRDVMMDYVPEGPLRVGALGLGTLLVGFFMVWGILWLVEL